MTIPFKHEFWRGHSNRRVEPCDSSKAEMSPRKNSLLDQTNGDCCGEGESGRKQPGMLTLIFGPASVL